MAFDASDLEAAFVRLGLYGLTIHRRGPTWGNKWVVAASYSGGRRKGDTAASEPNSSLEAALVEVLKMAPKRPRPVAPPDADYLDDLL